MKYQKVITLTEFILLEEKDLKQKTNGDLTLLLTEIENAAKIIASHVKRTGLVDILGHTGQQNVYDEEVQKLDEFSDQLLFELLATSGKVCAIASEEREEISVVNKKEGQYIVFIDPLDGSSNIDTNISIGTIFSIYKKQQNCRDLQTGARQIAAGYVMYGSSVMLVYTVGQGVNGFTLDPGIGSFLLSDPKIQIPNMGNTYSVNEGYFNMFEPEVQRYLTSIKEKPKPYSHRYVGSMISDIHRTLFKGGIFMNPPSKKSPRGKLRLMFEVNPMTWLVQQAGGKAVSTNFKDPLSILPLDLHQRVPIILGSPDNVEEYLQIVKK